MTKTGFALAMFGALCGGVAIAQDKPIDLKFSLWLPPNHANVASAKEWGESLAKASGGTLKVTVYPAQQLGKANDHYDMARDGIADISHISTGYEPGRLPVASVSQLPFMMTNATGGSRAFDEWYRRYVVKDAPGVRYCLGFAHDPGTLHAKKKIVGPEEIKGMKIRPAHQTMGNFVTLLGGTNVQASAPESREILERGVADAITFPWGSMLLFKIHDTVKFHMDMPFYVATFAWLVNPKKYDAMSPAQKKALDDHCSTEWAGKIADPWAKFEADGRAQLAADKGREVYVLTEAQAAAWKKAAEPLKVQWADAVRKANAGDPDAIFADLVQTLKKHNAAY